MNLRPGKRKKLSIPNDYYFIPKLSESLFTGYFNGVGVVVKESINELNNMGFYGKGSLSRSVPNFNVDDGFPDVVTRQQYENRFASNYGEDTSAAITPSIKNTELTKSSITKLFKGLTSENRNMSWSEWKAARGQGSSVASFANNKCSWLDSVDEHTQDGDNNASPIGQLVDEILRTGQPREMPRNINSLQKEVIVVSSDGPRMEAAPPTPVEALHLILEEAFFLALVGSLRVLHLDGTELEIQQLWNLFRSAEDTFLKRYVCYHWYRSKGWVVRPGIKYGSDFLLYEKGPPFCHSSYVVHVVGDEVFSWSDMIMLHRSAGNSNKDVLLCSVHPTTNLEEHELESPDVIKRYQIQETIYRRWVPSQERTTK